MEVILAYPFILGLACVVAAVLAVMLMRSWRSRRPFVHGGRRWDHGSTDGFMDGGGGFDHRAGPDVDGGHSSPVDGSGDSSSGCDSGGGDGGGGGGGD